MSWSPGDGRSGASESLDDVVLRIRARHRADPGRLLFGFAGPPGSGKSTVVERIAAELGELCAVVPMDGFHLANRQLAGTPLAARKGAIDTFDAHGYVHLLERLREQREVVYAPAYEREIEEPVASAIAVRPETPIVLTEGNYLLAETPPWSRVRQLLDATWYIETPTRLRLERLIARHRRFGKSPDAAAAWAAGPDEANAAFIARTRYNADAVLRWH